MCGLASASDASAGGTSEAAASFDVEGAELIEAREVMMVGKKEVLPFWDCLYATFHLLISALAMSILNYISELDQEWTLFTWSSLNLLLQLSKRALYCTLNNPLLNAFSEFCQQAHP